jgi:peptidoglycan hydrolase CwlO-like protein
MVIVNLVLAVIFLASAGTFLGAAESWKDKYAAETARLAGDLEAKDAQIGEWQGKHEGEMKRGSEVDGENKRIQAMLVSLQKSNENLNAALTKSQGNHETLATAQQDFQNKLNDLTTELQRHRDQLDAAKADAASARDEAETLRTQLAGEAAARGEAEAALAGQEAANVAMAADMEAQGVELSMYQKTFGSLGDIVAASPVSGVVKAVDNKLDIVVISAGSGEGVKPGYELTVFRGDEYISTIVIDKVFDKYSSGSTKPGMRKKDISAGDKVSNNL